MHGVFQLFARKVAPGDDHGIFIPFALGSALAHAEAAVAEQAFDERHVAVQFGKVRLPRALLHIALLRIARAFTAAEIAFTKIAFAEAAFVAAPVRGGKALRLSAFHGGNEHARRSRAEPVYRFRRGQIFKLIAACARAVISTRRQPQRERQCARQPQYRQCLFHSSVLLSIDFVRRECPEFPCLTYTTADGRGFVGGK